MRHRVTVKKFNRTASHRKAMMNNMVVSLFKYEKIETTKEKGKLLKSFADRLIHRAKTNTVHSRRIVAKFVKDDKILAKLFNEIAPRYKDVTGGYIRKLLSYKRSGDGAEMCVVMLTMGASVEDPKSKTKKEKAVKEK